LLENKKVIASQLNDLLTNLYRTEAHFPFAKVYDTKSSIKKFIEKILAGLDKKSTIYTIDTPEVGNYQKIYSEDVSDVMQKAKQKRQVTTHTLIPHNSFKKINQKKLAIQDIVIREMPAGINFQGSLWVLKDMIVHFSGNPPFIVAIKHEAIVIGHLSIFKFLWGISKEKN